MNNRRREKLYKKIKRQSHNTNFNDMKKLLEAYGFSVTNPTGGSHFMVDHPDIKDSIKPLPYQKPLKSYLVKQFINLIDEVKE